MKVKVEIDLEKPTYEWLDKTAKTLNMQGVNELLERELGDLIAEWEMWQDRFHNTEILYPSLFSPRAQML